MGFDAWMTKRIKRSERDAAYRARKSKARRERSRSPRFNEPSGSRTERGRARTRCTANTASAVTSASAVNPASAVTPAIAGTAVNTATAVTPAIAVTSASALTSASAVSVPPSASAGKVPGEKSPTPEHRRRSPRKAVPSARYRNESPPAKKHRSAAAPSKKKGGGAMKSGASEGSLGPTTRSSMRRGASATATTSAVSTAPAVTSAVAPSPPVRRTPTKAALKSYDAAQGRAASPVRDPLFPNLKSDPLGGDPYVDLFGEDSEGDDIPCGQQQNIERLLQLAGSRGLEENLLDPPTRTGYTAAATAGTKCASGVRHRGFGGSAEGGNSSSPAPTTGDDTVTPGDYSVAGGNLSQVGEAACSREETKVSLSLSVEVLASSVKETSPP